MLDGLLPSVEATSHTGFHWAWRASLEQDASSAGQAAAGSSSLQPLIELQLLCTAGGGSAVASVGRTVGAAEGGAGVAHTAQGAQGPCGGHFVFKSGAVDGVAHAVSKETRSAMAQRGARAGNGIMRGIIRASRLSAVSIPVRTSRPRGLRCG